MLLLCLYARLNTLWNGISTWTQKVVCSRLCRDRGGHQRQQARHSYRPNGAVYVASPSQILQSGFWTSETRGYLMPSERSIDIDVAQDLAMAEFIRANHPVTPFSVSKRKIGTGCPCFTEFRGDPQRAPQLRGNLHCQHQLLSGQAFGLLRRWRGLVYR